jgi:putative PLP-dependent aminotransferase (TIGR04422 family)
LSSKTFFLWPENHILNGLSSCWKLIETERIEKKLFEMFPTGYPVLCSSGRSALYLALSGIGTSRHSYVGVFPFASHCVLDTISRIATPATGTSANFQPIRLVYHQWGYVQEYNLPSNTIEDCVDTLCLPGTNLFPGGGDFEIWSLPKILGTTSGGILWCKNKEMAIQIKRLRDSKGSSLFQWILRLLSKNSTFIYNYWQGVESVIGRPSIFQTGEIMSAISRWDYIVSDRMKKLDLVWPLALGGLKKPTQRLPNVVPVESHVEEAIFNKLGLSSGFRMFEMVNEDGSRIMKSVLPLPIFQGIDFNWLMDIKKYILISNTESSNA